jgi:hypothetical protein
MFVTGTSAVGMNHKVFLGVAIEHIAKLGQVARADHDFGAHHEGRIDFLVAVLVDVNIGEPIDQRPLQSRTGALEQIETRAGKFDPALEVDDAQPGANLPVRQRREVKRRFDLPIA